ncbi:MAG TPA: thioesterase [Spirochaetota bacterium]|nr:thioesterase [Spirochaetota bacterium]HPJ38717.1 thioesterase [Spirochaetota bacterium]
MHRELALHTEQFTLRSYETDPHGRMSMVTLCNYFQEIGFNHAERLFNSLPADEVEQYAYVLTRLHVIMENPVCRKDTISITSWLLPMTGRFAIRNFRVYDSSGNTVARGINSALFFDLNERRPVPIPENAKAIPVKDCMAIHDDFSPLPRPERNDCETEFTVRYNDIDTYRHVNNVRYIEWAVETLPFEIRNNCFLEEMEINFRAETGFGDVLRSSAEINRDDAAITCHHCITRTDNGNEAAVLRTRWKALCGTIRD